MKKKSIVSNGITMGIVITVPFVATASNSYTVKSGDVLSKILQSQNIKPIYGREGALLETLKLNPQIRKQGNLIFPGMIIQLPASFNQTSMVMTQNRVNKVVSCNHSERELASEESSELVNQAQIYQVAKSKSVLEFDLSSKFFKVNSKDNQSGASANLLSEASNGLQIRWSQKWTQKRKSYLRYSKDSVSIMDSVSANKVLQGKSQTLSEFAVGYEQAYNENWEFGFEVSYGENLVNRAVDSNTVKIEKLQSLGLNSTAEYSIFEDEELYLSAFTGLDVDLPTKQDNYNASTSFGYRAGISVEDQVGPFKLQGSMQLKTSNIKMSEADFMNTDLGLYIGVKKDFSK